MSELRKMIDSVRARQGQKDAPLLVGLVQVGPGQAQLVIAPGIHARQALSMLRDAEADLMLQLARETPDPPMVQPALGPVPA